MKVSYNWLNEFIHLADLNPQDIGERMSRTGIEVDGVNALGTGLKKIVVGHVLTCEPHPDSDHLSITTVDVGEDEPFQIVCGAPNVAAGQKVIVALPNSRIAGNVKIKKGKMRGVVSQGMICSLEEIGFSNSVVPKEYADGIMVLPEEAPAGMDIVEYLKLDDPIIELDITPNRADAFSMRGVAWELAAVYNRQPKFDYTDITKYDGKDLAGAIDLKVADTELVPEYNAFLVKNVTVEPSPLWLQLRLMAAGIRPINNVVDITNYVLLANGQPLHAFDYDKLDHKVIETRLAKEGERIVTLDEVDRPLLDSDIVITDGEKPIALAGVMGGLDTEIDENTTNVLIEAANFEPIHIRKTARRNGLHSESSMRNERGINKATVAESGAFAAEMIADLANGELVEGFERVSAIDLTPILVTSSLAYVNKRIGMDLTFAEVQQIFDQLQFELSGDANEFTVSVPERRWDILIQADLVEEIARIYGYDKIPSRLPAVNAQNMGLTDWQAFKRRTNNQMLAEGFNQVIAYSLIGDNQTVLEMANAKPVALDFPMSDDRRFMRTNLLSALLEIVQYNVARKTSDVAIFESGRVFKWADADLPVDETHLAAVWTGNAQAKTWSHQAKAVDFYDMKGVVESILDSFNLDVAVAFEATSELADMHPGRTAKIYAVGQSEERVELGYIGQLHPSVADKHDLKDTLVFEISLDEIYALPKVDVKQSAIPKFPGSDRDIAILVSDQVSNADVMKTIQKASKGGILVDIEIFDVYQGENIEDGKKSLAYSLKYLNPQATLTDEEVTNDVARITEALTNELAAEIR